MKSRRCSCFLTKLRRHLAQPHCASVVEKFGCYEFLLPILIESRPRWLRCGGKSYGIGPRLSVHPPQAPLQEILVVFLLRWTSSFRDVYVRTASIGGQPYREPSLHSSPSSTVSSSSLASSMTMAVLVASGVTLGIRGALGFDCVALLVSNGCERGMFCFVGLAALHRVAAFLMDASVMKV
jgi:hypothetical protein